MPYRTQTQRDIKHARAWKTFNSAHDQRQLWVASMEAYIFLSTRPEVHWRVVEESLKIDGVKTAHAVTGPYDVVVYVVFEHMEMLGELIRRLHGIEGVEKTQTAVVVPPRLSD